jgi:hypothetical protein
MAKKLREPVQNVLQELIKVTKHIMECRRTLGRVFKVGPTACAGVLPTEMRRLTVNNLMPCSVHSSSNLAADASRNVFTFMRTHKNKLSISQMYPTPYILVNILFIYRTRFRYIDLRR